MAIIIPFPKRPVPVPIPASASAQAEPVRRKRGRTLDEEHRLAMLAKVHIALTGNKKNGTPALFATLPGFSEDVYRFALRERWGVDSSADMNRRQLHELLLWLRGLGFAPRKGRYRKDAPDSLTDEGDPFADKMRKIEALLAEKGRVEGTHMPWGYAVNILKRQTRGRCASFRSDQLVGADLDGVIAALCRDARRKGRYYEIYGRGVR